MFSRLATVSTVLFFAMFAAASAVPRTNPPATDQCNTGTIECCNAITQATDPSVVLIAGLLGVTIGPVTGLIGLTCNSITVTGGGGNSCTVQTACCTGNNFNGALVLGCTPLNINV